MVDSGGTIASEDYPLGRPEGIASPGLLVFRARVEENIARMGSLLEGLAPGSGFRHLRTHVKTCKSSWAVKLQMAAGISRFKASPNEFQMLLEAGARDIFLAYPPLPHVASTVARSIAEDQTAGGPPLRVLVQAGAREHVESLEGAAAENHVTIDCLIDLDVGMGRTGIPPESGLELFHALRDAPHLRFAGLHAYNGHNHEPDPGARIAQTEKELNRMVRLCEEIRHAGSDVPLIVAGGTPSFLPWLERLLDQNISREVEVSPGTWIYMDSKYGQLLPGMFQPAALVFARVMDRSGGDRLTLDLGHKRWAIDSGPVEIFSRKGLRVVSTSEEHTVVETSAETGKLRIGDHVLMVPRHVCPTINLWEQFSVIGPEGDVENPACPVDGRNR